MDGIAAIILAAGLSTRMGRPKLLLPWKNTSILGEIVLTLVAAGIPDIIVVTQKAQDQLDKHIQHLSNEYPVRVIQNESFEPEDMLSSIQYGLKWIKPPTQAALIALGDQPQIQENTIRLIVSAYHQNDSSIVIPSFQMRRGHPWLISHNFWSQFIELRPPANPRDFLDQHKVDINYVIVDNDSILQDIDTQEDYKTLKPS